MIMLIVLATPVLVLWYGEARRARLIASYEAPQSFIADLITKEKGPISEIMQSHETLVCAIDAYGRVDDFVTLNAKQKSSLPKDDLPSEGLAWYLLFFGSDSISRVYLVNIVQLDGYVEGSGTECIDREGHFSVLKTNDTNSMSEYNLSLIQGSKL